MSAAIRMNVRMRFLATVLLAVIFALVAGCAYRRDSAAAGTRDVGKATIVLRTDSTSYTARRATLRQGTIQERQRVEFDMVLMYTNLTDRPRYVAGCGTSFELRMEKLRGAQWGTAYAPVTPLCLGPVTVVQPGDSFAFPLTVRAFIRVPNPPRGFVLAYPFFQSSVPGRYRIRWEALYSTWTGDRPYVGLGVLAPESERTSTEFQVVEE